MVRFALVLVNIQEIAPLLDLFMAGRETTPDVAVQIGYIADRQETTIWILDEADLDHVEATLFQAGARKLE